MDSILHRFGSIDPRRKTSRSGLSPLGQAAYMYARAGLHVFPLGPNSKIPAIRHQDGGHGFYDATTDLAQVVAWWKQSPRRNLAIRTGHFTSPSGDPNGFAIFVLDVDRQHGGMDALDALRRLHGDAVTDTFTVSTPSGGVHLYYRLAAGISLPTTTAELAPGIDTKGDKGSITAPPSIVAKGDYRIAPGSARILAPVPRFVLDWAAERALLREKASEIRFDFSTGRSQENCQKWLAKAADSVAGMDAYRHNTLNQHAYTAGGMAAAGMLDPNEAADVLIRAGVAAGLAQREAAAVVRSGLQAGKRRPFVSKPGPLPGADPGAPNAPRANRTNSLCRGG